MAMVKELVVSVRTIRAEHDLPRSRALEVLFHAEQAERAAVLERERGLVERLIGGTLGRVDPAELDRRATGTSAVFVNPGLRAVVPDVIDVNKERDRLARELKKIEKDLAAAEKKLGNEGFLSRAPAEVVEQERARKTELTDRMAQMRAALDRLG
jgi:valyl-tRNA synthetase